MEFGNNSYKKKTYAPIIGLVVLLWACGEEERNQIIEADLTFQSISYASEYNASDEQFAEMLQYMDSVLTNSKEDTEEVKLLRYFSKLKKYGLLRKPYKFLHLKPDSVIIVHLSEEEYEKIKEFKYSDLDDAGEKVILKLEIEEFEKGIYYSNNILDVNKVKGKSWSDLDVSF